MRHATYRATRTAEMPLHRAQSPRRVPGLRSRRAVAVSAATLGVTTLLVGLAAVALAFWTGTSTGSGSGTTSSLQPLAASAPATSGLAPGVPMTVQVQVVNPNPQAITVTDAFARVAQPISGDCGPVAITFALSPPGQPVPAAGGPVTGTLTMDPDAPSDCQGDSFAIPLTLTGRVG